MPVSPRYTITLRIDPDLYEYMLARAREEGLLSAQQYLIQLLREDMRSRQQQDAVRK
jgi:hypothetical protein